jgi:hypothetical protein
VFTLGFFQDSLQRINLGSATTYANYQPSVNTRLTVRNGLFTNATEWYNSRGTLVARVDSVGRGVFVGLTTTGSITATSQTLAIGAITSSGALALGTNTITSGPHTATGLSIFDSLRVKGARYEGIDTTSLSRTVTTETTLLCNNTTNITITLPALALAYNAATKTGRVLFIKKNLNNSATVTIDGAGSETIDGFTSIVTDVGKTSYEIIAHFSGWIIR